jgi:hypothetical protein
MDGLEGATGAGNTRERKGKEALLFLEIDYRLWNCEWLMKPLSKSCRTQTDEKECKGCGLKSILNHSNLVFTLASTQSLGWIIMSG